MAQSEVRGNHSTGEDGDPIARSSEREPARGERPTRTVTGHPEDHRPREREPRSEDDEPRDDRPTPRFQSNRLSPAERDEMVKGARDVRFPVALRGYERVAVDRYVREVNRLMAELEISSSPEAAIRHALDEVSEETREILQRAHQSAEELTARSRAKADDRLQQAEREAQELREASQSEAEELREQAASEAAATRERAAAEARELRETAAAEVRELRESAAQEAEQQRQTASDEAQRVRATAQREADELRASSRRDSEEMLEQAETRARELSHNAETIWRERRRLVEDMRGVGEQLVAMGETESKRFARFPEEMAHALEPSRSPSSTQSLPAEVGSEASAER